MVAPGFEFKHHYLTDPDWVPGPGQTYRDAPRMDMVVVRVTKQYVHYVPVGVKPTRTNRMLTVRKGFELQYGCETQK